MCPSSFVVLCLGFSDQQWIFHDSIEMPIVKNPALFMSPCKYALLFFSLFLFVFCFVLFPSQNCRSPMEKSLVHHFASNVDIITSPINKPHEYQDINKGKCLCWHHIFFPFSVAEITTKKKQTIDQFAFKVFRYLSIQCSFITIFYHGNFNKI